MTFFSHGAENSKYSRDYVRVTELRESKETGSFENMAKEIKENWSRVDNKAYAKLMAHTLKSWISACKRSNETVPMNKIQEYAISILSTYDPAKSDNIDIETEFEFVRVIDEKYTYSKGTQTDEEWQISRQNGQDRWIHVWQRLEKAIDQNWDINDVPVENVDLPEGAEGIPGMAPNLIKDPVLRAEYEKAIKENNEKNRIRNEQLKLRNLRNQYAPIIEKYLVSTYSIPPYNIKELKQYLDNYSFAEKTQIRIIDAVTKITESQNTNEQ